MSLPEPLPCPFCGGNPELYDTLPGGQYWYRCEECCGETEGGETRADATAAWNRRASPSQVAPANPAQVTDAEIKAYREKYREIFPGSHPDRQTIIELLTASKEAASAASEAFRSTLTAAIGAGGQAVAWTDEKGRTLPDLMSKWRRRDEGLDRGTWLGVSEIAGRIQRDKTEVRKELSELADAGAIERSDVSNGTFWRGALSQPHPADERVVEALEKARYELWRMGATEAEYDALWLVRRALASLSQPAKDDLKGGGA